jgi:hypothetical protein
MQIPPRGSVLLERHHSSKRLCVHLQAELEDQVQISTSFEDLCDQNVIVYLLRTKSKEYMPQVLRPVRPSFSCLGEQEGLQSERVPMIVRFIVQC